MVSSPSPITGKFLSLVPGPLSADMLLIPLHSSPDTLHNTEKGEEITSTPAFGTRHCLKRTWRTSARLARGNYSSHGDGVALSPQMISAFCIPGFRKDIPRQFAVSSTPGVGVASPLLSERDFYPCSCLMRSRRSPMFSIKSLPYL